MTLDYLIVNHNIEIHQLHAKIGIRVAEVTMMIQSICIQKVHHVETKT
jgi:hypothetical protein